MYDLKWCVEASKRLVNPNKTYRILEANGIRTWKDLVFMTKKDLLKIKGLGPKSVDILWDMARKEESMCPEKYFKGKAVL